MYQITGYDDSRASSYISPLSPSPLNQTPPPYQKTTFSYNFPTSKGIRDCIRSSRWSPEGEWHKRVTQTLLITTLLASLAALTWLSLVLTVTNRLRIPQSRNGLQQILSSYRAPTLAQPATPTWLENFSAGVAPVQCHSHNDYQHRVPLYEGLGAGCNSTEADIWIGNTTDGRLELFVGHSRQSLRESRTLRSLYLDPLFAILTRQNSVPSDEPIPLVGGEQPENRSPIGVFDVAPSTSLVLLLDFKTGDSATWDTVMAQLEDFRAQDWLTYWTATTGVVRRPLAIVASGAAPFDAITSNTTHRDIFYDAPLTELADEGMPYTSNNSFYASASLRDAVGYVSFGNLLAGQKAQIRKQVGMADQLGLQSRYWDTPSWPVGWRNRIWDILVTEGAKRLNIDDLIAAARWDWQMCVVGGVSICNT